MEYSSLKASQKCFCSSSGSIASVTSSSSGRSSNETSEKHGFRTVHLRRQCGFYLESNGRTCDQLVANPRPSNFGFSFRGGREFGTGFFVSAVENDSEAQLKGLRVGDQIIRINGLSVEDATHQEVLQLAQSHHQLTLTVKSVGLIPVKDKSEDPLTWKVVENDETPLLPVGSDVDRIRIEIPENCQLGCGICKGPDWRPGIFVQYTKPNSLARRCGLQPGDQILQCNRISFLQIDFSYAVSVLKNTRTLDLVLKKGSGIDLFPGESSGYSSSSSIADEFSNHCSSTKTKRLSIVAEESDDRYHRRTCHCKLGRNGTLKSSGSIDSVFECVPGLAEGPGYRERSKSIEILADPQYHNSVTFQNHDNVTRTFLNIGNSRDSCRHCLVGNQTVIKIESNEVRDASQGLPKMSVEKIGEGRISVEVHRSDEKCAADKVPIEKSPSSSSFSSSSSLSSAISREIQRRNERKLKEPPPGRQERNELLKPVGKQHRHQHDLLIAELKRKQGCEEKTSNASTQTDGSKSSSDPTIVPSRQGPGDVTSVVINGKDPSSNAEATQPKVKAAAPVSTFRPFYPPCPVKSPPDSPPACPTPDYYSDLSLTDQSIEASHTVRNSILKFEEKNKSSNLPNGVHKTVTFGLTSTKEITPIKNFPREPVPKNPSPMADKDAVEMQSIESYELTEPKQVAPKPPPVYFHNPARSDIAPESKKRTTVIKITEYPTAEKRREPVKFDFLRGAGRKDANAFDAELASTLSRSNLRNKVDAFAKVTNSQSIVPRNGPEKTCTPGNYPHGYNGLHGSPVIATAVTEKQLSNVRKTLKTFEKTTGNTVVLKIPKRN